MYMYLFIATWQIFFFMVLSESLLFWISCLVCQDSFVGWVLLGVASVSVAEIAVTNIVLFGEELNLANKLTKNVIYSFLLLIWFWFMRPVVHWPSTYGVLTCCGGWWDL